MEGKIRHRAQHLVARHGIVGRLAQRGENVAVKLGVAGGIASGAVKKERAGIGVFEKIAVRSGIIELRIDQNRPLGRAAVRPVPYARAVRGGVNVAAAPFAGDNVRIKRRLRIGGGQREEPVKKYRGLGARNGLTAVHRNGRHGVFYGVGRESAVKQRRERYFRERERGVVHGERDTGGALHGFRGLSGGQRIRAAEKAVFTAHIPRGVHRRGSGLRRRFDRCFRYGRRRDSRRSGRAEKADAGTEERERREQHDSKHRARDDEPDGLFPVFHRFFCFVYLGHGMPPKR